MRQRLLSPLALATMTVLVRRGKPEAALELLALPSWDEQKLSRNSSALQQLMRTRRLAQKEASDYLDMERSLQKPAENSTGPP